MTIKRNFLIVGGLIGLSLAGAGLVLSQVSGQKTTGALAPVSPIGAFTRLKVSQNASLASDNNSWVGIGSNLTAPAPSPAGNAKLVVRSANGTIAGIGDFGMNGGGPAGPLQFRSDGWAMYAP